MELHGVRPRVRMSGPVYHAAPLPDRKSTRLNSSHANISYAVFCLKKKKKTLQMAVSYLIHTIKNDLGEIRTREYDKDREVYSRVRLNYMKSSKRVKQ